VIGLDTTVVVRYLAQDDRVQSAIAARFMSTLTKDRPGFISAVVLAEISWVMSRSYRLGRSENANIIRTLLETAELIIENAEAAYRALGVYVGSASVEFADVLIAETASRAGADKTVTFDKAAAAEAGMRLLK
jgi:predicted nucleic-acid-binding protein